MVVVVGARVGDGGAAATAAAAAMAGAATTVTGDAGSAAASARLEPDIRLINWRRASPALVTGDSFPSGESGALPTLKLCVLLARERSGDSSAGSVAVAATTQLSERNTSATRELAATLKETSGTIEELAQLSHELQAIAMKFKC